MKNFIFAACTLSLLFNTAQAQTCKADSITPSHGAGQYLVKDDGTVTDIVHGIEWQLCSVGQTYNSEKGNCDGTPTQFSTWSEALSNTDSAYGAYDDWRLPNIKELGSLVDRSCIAPAIDLSVFVSTASVVYWSSTYDNRVNNIQGRIIDFYDGSEFLKNPDGYRFVRLVRSLSLK